MIIGKCLVFELNQSEMNECSWLHRDMTPPAGHNEKHNKMVSIPTCIINLTFYYFCILQWWLAVQIQSRIMMCLDQIDHQKWI